MKVLKFGGTSVGSVENIEKVISIIEVASKENRIAVVVSAFGGVTDQLIHAGNLAAAKNSNYVSIFNSIKEQIYIFNIPIQINNRASNLNIYVLVFFVKRVF